MVTAQGSAAASASEEGGNLRCPVVEAAKAWHKPPVSSSNDESLTSLKVSGLGSPLCGLRPTDKTEIPTRDINHSMTHLTHRPLSSAEHPIIRLNAAGSYKASLSNG